MQTCPELSAARLNDAWWKTARSTAGESYESDTGCSMEKYHPDTLGYITQSKFALALRRGDLDDQMKANFLLGGSNPEYANIFQTRMANVWGLMQTFSGSRTLTKHGYQDVWSDVKNRHGLVKLKFATKPMFTSTFKSSKFLIMRHAWLKEDAVDTYLHKHSAAVPSSASSSLSHKAPASFQAPPPPPPKEPIWFAPAVGVPVTPVVEATTAPPESAPPKSAPPKSAPPDVLLKVRVLPPVLREVLQEVHEEPPKVVTQEQVAQKQVKVISDTTSSALDKEKQELLSALAAAKQSNKKRKLVFDDSSRCEFGDVNGNKIHAKLRGTKKPGASGVDFYVTPKRRLIGEGATLRSVVDIEKHFRALKNGA